MTKINELVDQYIDLRAQKTALKADYDLKKEGVDAEQKRIEIEILRHCEQFGVESIRTANGTAYRTTRASATVGDWDAVLSFIRDNNLWHMLERRVSKDAVVQWREENSDLPPGVNWREEVVVNVRKS